MNDRCNHPLAAGALGLAWKWLKTILNAIFVFALALAIMVVWFLARVGSDAFLDGILPSFALFALEALLTLFALAVLFALAAMFAPGRLGLGHPYIAIAIAAAGSLFALFTPLFSLVAVAAVALLLVLSALLIVFTAFPIKSGTDDESRKRPFAVRALVRARKSAVFKVAIWLQSVVLSLALVPLWAVRFFASDDSLYREGAVPYSAWEALYALDPTLPLFATLATLGVFMALPANLRAGTHDGAPFAVRALGKARNSGGFKAILWLGSAAFVAFALLGIVVFLSVTSIERGGPNSAEPPAAPATSQASASGAAPAAFSEGSESDRVLALNGNPPLPAQNQEWNPAYDAPTMEAANP